MATNNFQFRGALGGLLAGDQELRKATTERLNQQNLALQARATADAIMRDRQFKAKERQQQLDLGKQKLIEAVRTNRLGEMFGEAEASAEVRTKTAEADITEKKAELTKQFGTREAEASVRNKELENILAPRRVAAQEMGARASMSNAQTNRGQLAIQQDVNRRTQETFNVNRDALEAKAKADVATAIAEAATIEEAKKAALAYQKASAERMEADARRKDVETDFIRATGRKPGSGRTSMNPQATGSDIKAAVTGLSTQDRKSVV